MEQLFQFIFRWYAKRKSLRSKKYRNLSQIKSVIIIFESDFMEKNTLVKGFIEQLKQEGKDVDAWAFVDKKETLTSTIAQFRIIGQKDINWLKIPRQKAIADMTDKHYDLLIDLHINQNITNQYLTLFANAELKVGVSLQVYTDVKPNVLDFMIKLPEHSGAATETDTTELFNQIIHYLKIIQ